jgi:hypothetical protein
MSIRNIIKPGYPWLKLVFLGTQEADRDQEDSGSKIAEANSSARHYLKKTPSQKRAGEVAQSVGPSSSPSTTNNVILFLCCGTRL